MIEVTFNLKLIAFIEISLHIQFEKFIFTYWYKVLMIRTVNIADLSYH